MGDGTSLLFDLNGFRVVSVVRSAPGVRVVTIAGLAAEQACPDCGVYSGRVHSRWMQAVKDLPYGRSLQVRWDKRRFACDEPACPRRTFTEVTDQLGRRRRLTRRLRTQLEAAAPAGLRSVAGVAREYGVSWWSANQALIERAADVLGPAPPGVRRLGIDETRVRRVRWINFLQLDITNARTEGYNRTIKSIKRVGCGFRNATSYRRRIMLHVAATAA